MFQLRASSVELAASFGSSTDATSYKKLVFFFFLSSRAGLKGKTVSAVYSTITCRPPTTPGYKRFQTLKHTLPNGPYTQTQLQRHCPTKQHTQLNSTLLLHHHFEIDPFASFLGSLHVLLLGNPCLKISGYDLHVPVGCVLTGT